MLLRRRAAEDGQAMLLGIGMIAVVLALTLGIASVTSVYLDVKRLTAMADSAAVAGAGRIAPDGYYTGGPSAAPVAMDDASVRSAAVDDLVSQAEVGVASAGGLSDVSVRDAHVEDGRVAVVTLSGHSRPPFLPWGVLPFEGFDISAAGSARTTTAP
ncbi:MULTISPECIES: pilus assembly protein TadG-related protein [Actinomyces]|uniref:pilus assembly protein TadG-related protein n=1 Tax=Actinomyces TaxID=1654 RepID=UPI001F2C357C|nr:MULTISPECIES: pilus assembly protein TadG-related protein [Actinomyces]